MELATRSDAALSRRIRFGPGKLPIEYTPLNSKTAIPGTIYGPVEFTASSSSHQHHLEHFCSCGIDVSHIAPGGLFPFEFWALPRVLSRAYFGRLNEVISIRAKRLIHSFPEAGDLLFGEAEVKSVSTRNGLCIGRFSSATKSRTGKLCLEAEDVILLANGCTASSLHDTVSQAHEDKWKERSEAEHLLDTVIRMRFEWRDTEWINNIHTDSYAKSIGYEGALVEGPVVADLVWLVDQLNVPTEMPLRLSWRYMTPLYQNAPVTIVSDKSNQSALRRYYVCKRPEATAPVLSVLTTVEIRQ